MMMENKRYMHIYTLLDLTGSYITITMFSDDLIIKIDDFVEEVEKKTGLHGNNDYSLINYTLFFN